MSDDLNLLITFLNKGKTLSKVVLHVPHGMNTFSDYVYFREDDVWRKFKELLPPHVIDFIEIIVSVEEIFEIVKKG